LGKELKKLGLSGFTLRTLYGQKNIKISEREKTLWASRRKSSVEIYTSKEKQFKIILTQHIGKSLRILYKEKKIRRAVS
jgi:hypothetical protein